MQIRTGIKRQLQPTSSLDGLKDLPQYIVYNQLLMTSKEYTCKVTAVNPFWIFDAAPLLYDLKRVKRNDTSDQRIFGINSEKNTNEKTNSVLDEKINICSIMKNKMIKNLKKDNDKFLETKSNSIQDNKGNSIDNDNATIGFKKRKVFKR